MAFPRVQLEGQTFGNLTVVKRIGASTNAAGRTESAWLCHCLCGAPVVRTTNALRAHKPGKRQRAAACKACVRAVRRENQLRIEAEKRARRAAA